jgi:hypothetical protein
MQALILQEAGPQTLAEQARREGVGTLRLAGLQKVLQGITSLNEVLAHTQAPELEHDPAQNPVQVLAQGVQLARTPTEAQP